jgi:hypothetical protein
MSAGGEGCWYGYQLPRSHVCPGSVGGDPDRAQRMDSRTPLMIDELAQIWPLRVSGTLLSQVMPP